MSTAAVIQARIRRMVKQFYDAGALNAAGAKSLAVLGLEDWRNGRIIHRLVSKGILVRTKQDAYYLDMEAYHRDRRFRQRVGFGLLVALAVCLVIMLIVEGYIF